jgi:hypothetical protein
LEDFACDVAFERPDDLGFGAALGETTLHVGDGAGFALAEAGQHDPPQGVVRLAVAALVEAVPAVGLAGAGWHRGDPTDLGPGRLGADPAGVVAGGEEDGGGVRADAVDLEQGGCVTRTKASM